MTVSSRCANSGRRIRFRLDTRLTLSGLEPGADPMFCVPLMNTEKTTARCILDIF